MTQKYKDLVHADPRVMMGKPVIKGTRITVEHILEKLAHGETFQDIFASHPQLTEESIRAAIAYALEVLRTDEFFPAPEVKSEVSS